MKKKDVFLTLIAIAALFGVACFVQTEMDRLIHESDEWVCWSVFAGAGWFYGYRRLCCRHFYRACRAAA